MHRPIPHSSLWLAALVWITLAWIFVLLFPGCTLTVYEKEHGDWESELAELTRGMEGADGPTLCCRSRFNPKGNGYFSSEELVVIKVLKDGPFRVATGKADQAPLYAYISAQESPGFNISLLFFLLTLGLSPNMSTMQMTLDITFLNPEGEVVKGYRREADYRFWTGWVFLLWPPGWMHPKLVRGWMLKDLARDIVAEIYREDHAFFMKYGS